nr:MAG TPA: hypothetical protein [Caudoviricetes sp.]
MVSPIVRKRKTYKQGARVKDTAVSMVGVAPLL